MVKKQKAAKAAAATVKLDFGCGPNKKTGFVGVDAIAFPGVDVTLNLGVDPWPWAGGSVSEGHASHFVEHLTGLERVHFFNELHRVLVPGGQCFIQVPHCASSRAYGDFTHQWPPVGEFFFYYLDRDWRKTNAPHNDIEFNPQGYTCHFHHTGGYSLRGDLVSRNADYQQYALANFKEAAQDMLITVTKPV